MEKISIRGVNFDNVTMDEAVEICKCFLRDDSGAKIIHTPNAEITQLCVEDEKVKKTVNGADLIIPDGAGVVLASKILKKKLKCKVAGIELCENLARISGEMNAKIFFLGGKPGIPDKAAEKLLEKYPDMLIAGTNDGYFKSDEEIIEKINASGADIVFVCLGVPKQEQWMEKHRKDLNIKLMGGFGGSFDVLSGTIQRAPKIFIKLNLEWFYRLCKEPKRIGRMMKLPKFIFGSIKDRIFKIER
ncbi:MAG: WecB/TagA/CpsF family glycosyltransferase [Ruminococcaceae bacterium]|nr:WecB/TagA/CpsF family glycosyltransferase [Oscillospiraceae bacterium]